AAAPARRIQAAGHRPAGSLPRSEDRYPDQALFRDPAAPSALRRRTHAPRVHRTRAGISIRSRRPRAPSGYQRPHRKRAAQLGQGLRYRAPHHSYPVVRVVRLQGRHSARRRPGVRRTLSAQPALRCEPEAPYRTGPARDRLPLRRTRLSEDVRGHPPLRRRMAAELRARQPQLFHCGNRLHRRPAPVGVPGGSPRRPVPRPGSGAGPPSRIVIGRGWNPFHVRVSLFEFDADHRWRITLFFEISMAADSTREIFLFPLNTVLFPEGVLPLKVFELRYIEMTKTCLRDNIPFGFCLIREGPEVGTAALPARVGCLATIAQWEMPQLGLFHLLTRGGQRFRVRETRVAPNQLITAKVELLPLDP